MYTMVESQYLKIGNKRDYILLYSTKLTSLPFVFKVSFGL